MVGSHVFIEGIRLDWKGGDQQCVSQEELQGTGICPVAGVGANGAHYSVHSFPPKRNKNAWKLTGTS